MEGGDDAATDEPFSLPLAIEEATYSYRNEAERRGIKFVLDVHSGPKMVVGDAKKIRAVVQNLTANACERIPHLLCLPRDHADHCAMSFSEPHANWHDHRPLHDVRRA